MKGYLGKQLFSIIVIMLFPCSMCITSSKYAKKPPTYKNGGIQWSGYKIGKADRSKETWEFSQKYFFSWAEWIAFFEIIGSIVIIIKYWKMIMFTPFQLVMIGIQLVLVLLPAIPTEVMLHKLFDKNGKRKS